MSDVKLSSVEFQYVVPPPGVMAHGERTKAIRTHVAGARGGFEHVCDLELDTDSGCIAGYAVKDGKRTGKWSIYSSAGAVMQPLEDWAAPADKAVKK